MSRSVLIVGGTSGLGRALAENLSAAGDEVTITGRDPERTAAVAAEIGPSVRSLAFDLSEPATVPDALREVGPVDHLVLAAIERDDNFVRDYAVDRALRLVTLKLVGYTAVVNALEDRLGPGSSIVLFGGLAKERPYPGSTTVSTINGGVSGLARTLAHELAPVRVNAVHPGIVGDSPAWRDKPAPVLDGFVRQTPIGRLVTMQEVVDAVRALIDNPAINGVEMVVDGGWLLNWTAPATS